MTYPWICPRCGRVWCFPVTWCAACNDEIDRKEKESQKIKERDLSPGFHRIPVKQKGEGKP